MANVKRNFRLMRELLQTQIYMMEDHALAAYRHQLLNNFNQHVLAEDLEIPATESHHMVCYKKGTREVTAVQFFDENLQLVEETPNGDMVTAHEPHEDEERVLMLELTGPVTRSGGMCSYGSQDFRDMLKEYADDPSVVGMVLITDTPGGTAFALHDFKQGMAAWNAAGKRSIQWIDGMSCSAGVALGSQCQKILAYNEKDVVGCIGAMMAGWTTADGTIDENGNRFIDLVASQTPDKNGEFRAAAAGDYEGLQKMLDECGQDFLNLLAEVRPQIPADMKTGKTYDAGDCIGTLIDGIGSLEDAVHYALTGEENWTQGASATVPSPSGEGQGGANPADDPDHNPNDDPDFDPEDDPMNQSASNTPNNSLPLEGLGVGSNNNQPDASAEGTISKYDMTLLEKIAAALGIKTEVEAQAEVPAAEQTVETPAEGEQSAEGAQAPVEGTEAPVSEASAEEGTQQPAEGVEGTQATEGAEGEQPAEGEQSAEGEQPEGKCKPKAEGEEGEGEGDEEEPEGEGKCKPQDGCDPEKKCEALQAQVTDLTAERDNLQAQLAEFGQLKQTLKEEMEQNATAQSDLNEAKAELEAMKAAEAQQITDLKAQLADATKASEAHAETVHGLEKEKEALNSQLSALTSRVSELESLLKEASAELKEFQESAPAAPQAPAVPHDNHEATEDNVPADFGEAGTMTGADMIAIAKKKEAKRKAAKK